MSASSEREVASKWASDMLGATINGRSNERSVSSSESEPETARRNRSRGEDPALLERCTENGGARSMLEWICASDEVARQKRKKELCASVRSACLGAAKHATDMRKKERSECLQVIVRGRSTNIRGSSGRAVATDSASERVGQWSELQTLRAAIRRTRERTHKGRAAAKAITSAGRGELCTAMRTRTAAKETK